MRSYVDAICPISTPSRTDEAAFLAFVFHTLVTALGAPADLLSTAAGAFEESVARTLEPDAAGGTYFVCHGGAIMIPI